MKRNIVIVACLTATAFIHAAEPQAIQKYHDYDCHGTTIRLIKGSLFEADGKVDVLVVGRNQQRSLQEPDFGDSSRVGMTYFTDSKIWLKKKDSESASDDDIIKFFDLSDNNMWESAEAKKTSSKVLCTLEPRIVEMYVWKKGKQVKKTFYCPHRPHPTKDNCFTLNEYSGDQISEESKKDLAVCLENVFAELKAVKDPFTFYGLIATEHKTPGAYKLNVAFPSLGTPVGMLAEDAVPVAVDTVIDCLKNNPNMFTMVQFAIKNRTEFALYKKLLNEKFSKIN